MPPLKFAETCLWSCSENLKENLPSLKFAHWQLVMKGAKKKKNENKQGRISEYSYSHREPGCVQCSLCPAGTYGNDSSGLKECPACHPGMCAELGTFSCIYRERGIFISPFFLNTCIYRKEDQSILSRCIPPEFSIWMHYSKNVENFTFVVWESARMFGNLFLKYMVWLKISDDMTHLMYHTFLS